MKTATKVSKNTAWQIGSKITNAVTGLVIINILHRLYGDAGVGIYSTIIAYISFYFMPVDFGLNAIAVKHVLSKHKAPKEVFGNLLGIRLLLSGILITIALLLALTLPYNQKTNTGYSDYVKIGIILSSLSILAQAMFATANAYFQATEKYRNSFIANAISACINIAIFSALLFSGVPLHIAIISLAISGVIGGITAILLVKRTLGKVEILLDPKYCKSIIVESAPLTISLMLNLIYFRIDSLILPFYIQIGEVGKYNIAYKIFETILVIPNYFANALYPVLLQKYNNSISSFIHTIKKSALSLSIIATLGTISSYMLAPVMVWIVTGSYNNETANYIRILTSGLVIFFLSSITMWSLVVLGKQKYLAYIYGVTMTINIILNLIFIPAYGAIASAYITILTEAVVLLISGPLLLIQLNKKSKE